MGYAVDPQPRIVPNKQFSEISDAPDSPSISNMRSSSSGGAPGGGILATRGTSEKNIAADPPVPVSPRRNYLRLGTAPLENHAYRSSLSSNSSRRSTLD